MVHGFFWSVRAVLAEKKRYTGSRIDVLWRVFGLASTLAASTTARRRPATLPSDPRPAFYWSNVPRKIPTRTPSEFLKIINKIATSLVEEIEIKKGWVL
jgi:hypothetical protein